jgi:hypothetical protein
LDLKLISHPEGFEIRPTSDEKKNLSCQQENHQSAEQRNRKGSGFHR